MSNTKIHPPSAGLKQSLGLKDLVLLNIAGIVGFSTMSQVAQFGLSSMTLYIIVVLTFLIPSGLMVAELNYRMPEEGGLYRWTRTAFGDVHGYIVAWSYWLSNIVWLPTMMLVVSASGVYMLGKDYHYLADSKWYNGAVYIGALWFITILNILGMQKAKWIQNVGAIALWITFSLLAIGGFIFIMDNPSGHGIAPGSLVPDFTDLSILPFFAMVAFCFGGLELAPVLTGEIKDPGRNIPRAIYISAVAVAVIYIAGTLALVLVIPEDQVDLVAGVAQAFQVISNSTLLPGIGIIGVVLIALSTTGSFGAWMTGTARIPFVIGLDKYLPPVIARVHPRYGSPYVSLLMQSVVLTLLFLASVAGTSMKEAFLTLLDMSIILYFIPFLYMFASLPVHVKRETGGRGIITLFKKSGIALWIVSLAGFVTTLLSAIASTLPSDHVENKIIFFLKVIGGAFLLIGIGLIVFFIKEKRRNPLPLKTE